MSGTSNANVRGNSRDRLARRTYLVTTYQSDHWGLCRCYRCGTLLSFMTVTVDRIIPGCKGGKYVRNNIRPACSACNSETGGRTRGNQ